MPTHDRVSDRCLRASPQVADALQDQLTARQALLAQWTGLLLGSRWPRFLVLGQSSVLTAWYLATSPATAFCPPVALSGGHRVNSRSPAQPCSSRGPVSAERTRAVEPGGLYKIARRDRVSRVILSNPK
jgi:hypothetical protein